MNRSDSIYTFMNSAVSYEQQISNLKSNDLNILPKAKEINSNISNDIIEMNILVESLDPNNEKNEEVLKLVLYNLTTLGKQLNKMSSLLETASENPIFKAKKDAINEEARRVGEIYNMVKQTSNSVFKVQNYMQDFPFAKTESELKNIAQIEAANLSMQSGKSSITDGILGFFSDWFPPEPEITMKGGQSIPLSEFIGEKHVDEKSTIEDYAGIMKNKKYGELVFFKDLQGNVICEEDGFAFTAPLEFVKDVVRSDQFKLNGKTLLETKYEIGNDADKDWVIFKNISQQTTGNPNSIAREMYQLFGTTVANRLLKLCFQGITSNLIGKMFAKCSTYGSNPGEYAKAISRRLKIPMEELMIAPGNEFGMYFDIETDKKDNVSVTIKFMMRLHKDSSTFTARVPAKIKITMPIKSLYDENFDKKTGKELGIHVEETLGKLFINDRRTAAQVLEKL